MFYRFHLKTKFKKCLTKAVAMVVAVSMLSFSVSPITCAFAQTNSVSQLPNKALNMPDCTIVPNDDGSISVKSENEESTIRVHETCDTRTVVVTDEKSGSSNKLVLDKKSNTLFSTYTSKTIQLGDYDQQALQNDVKPSRVKRAAANPDYLYQRISWRRIKNTVGPAVTVAGFILAFAPQAKGVLIASKLASALGAGSIGIPDDDHHGILLVFGPRRPCVVSRIVYCGRASYPLHHVETY